MPRGAKQFRDFLFSQTDLVNEAKNLVEFKENFPDDNKMCVRFPDVFEEFVTKDILVMSYEAGESLDQITQALQSASTINEEKYQRKSKLTNKNIANIGVQMFCKMLHILRKMLHIVLFISK